MDQPCDHILAAIATTNPPVCSVTASLANLDLNPPCIGDGGTQINRLPNKLLQRILSKVERMILIDEFASLRVVDTRWRAIVDDIFKDKKSVILVILDVWKFPDALQVEVEFFGLLNVTNSLRVNIRACFSEDDLDDEELGNFEYNVPDNIFKSLFKALPNIEQLYIYCTKSDKLDGQIASHVNSLCSLKQLYVYGGFDILFKRLQQNTLTRLEFFFFNIKRSSVIYKCYDYVRCGTLNFDYVRQLHARKPRWLENVTQLYFPIGLSDQFGDQIVPFLREQTPRLNVLDIKFCDTTLMTPALFGQLGMLNHLTEISLGPVLFEVLSNLSKFVEYVTPWPWNTNNCAPLTTITTCNLVIADLDVRSVTVDQFTRVLLAIFPLVVKWKLAFVPNVLASFRTQLVQKLDNGENYFYIHRSQRRRCEIFEKNVDEFFELLNSYTY